MHSRQRGQLLGVRERDDCAVGHKRAKGKHTAIDRVLTSIDRRMKLFLFRNRFPASR
jgi:hypothetical protein